MKFKLFFLFISTLILSCASVKKKIEPIVFTSKPNGITKEYDKDGTLKFEWNYTDNILNGISTEYHPNKTFSKWNYKDGELIAGKAYYSCGTLMEEYTFLNGKREGFAYRYYQTGEKETAWLFKNDILVSGKGFYPTGEKKIDFSYVNGIPEGIAKEYYKNGAIKMEWSYSNGILNGVTKEYFDNGRLKYTWNYREGKVL
ncbi:toxin-antitoxin system YwqK family antitoxin [Aquimarina aquimarini]|uniref:toxin-antitoxin system YwqK family antitoxin n=1 Tax=Aquimarina aquimarini TaxID=1191734 RepID=UPI001F34E996|nr:hypothetical protein [Aquimarina aquimarini]